MFVRLPFTFMVVLSVSVQRLEGFNTPPLKVKVRSPGTAVKVPPQVPVDRFGGLAINMPSGIVSVKPTPVKTVLFGLTNCTLIMDEEPPNTVSGAKPFTTPRESGVIFKIALASATGRMTVPSPERVPETFSLLTVLVRSVAALAGEAITSTLMVQMPGTPPTCAGMVPLASEMVCWPAVTLTSLTLPQVELLTGPAATVISVPPMVLRLSVSETPVTGTVFVFDNVIVSVDFPPGLTVPG